MKTIPSSLLFFNFFLYGVHCTSEMVDPNAKVRHNFNARPMELNVDAKDTYNDKFMALMESPCRPEKNGYFGATYGEPVKITYGFQLEVQPLSPIMDLLDIVKDKVVDNALSQMFPQVCGFRRRRLGSYASGFRFYTVNEKERCDPSQDPVNFCGLFTGQVNIYGKDQDKASLEVLKIIRNTLSPSDPTKLHPGLVRMTYAKGYQDITGGNAQLQEEKNRQILLWAGLALSIVLFTCTIWWLFLRGDKQGDTGLHKNMVQKQKGWRFPRRQRDSDFDLQQKPIKTSYEQEVSSHDRTFYSDKERSFVRPDDFEDDEYDVSNEDSSVSATTAEIL